MSAALQSAPPHRVVAGWLAHHGLLAWAFTQSNAALRDQAAAQVAARLLADAGLPLHPDAPKNWDGFLAVLHAITSAGPDEPVLDAGAERYSCFLPALRHLGFSDLTGINLTFGAPELADGIRFQHGDITRTDFAAASFAFIASLSVIEHGVDVGAFFREAARLLRPGGALFVSFDYWQDKVDTRGQLAYGVPIRIFCREDVAEMQRLAEAAGLVTEATSGFACQERVVHWQRFDLRYTFANLLLRKPYA